MRLPIIHHDSQTKIIKVYIRLMLLRVGEIDTLNEKYQAQASIEARWTVKSEQLLANLSADDQNHLMDGNDKVILLPDPHRQGGVNREAFVDQQEWSLYQRVDIEQRLVKEFLVEDIDKR